MTENTGFQNRPIGRKQTLVSPIGLAGSTLGVSNPPEDVYIRGMEHGINLFLWDRSFKPMTNVLMNLPDNTRNKLFICVLIPFGGPKQIRKWVSKKLETLKLDKISCLMLKLG